MNPQPATTDGLGIPLVIAVGGLAALLYLANEINRPHERRRCRKKGCKRC